MGKLRKIPGAVRYYSSSLGTFAVYVGTGLRAIRRPDILRYQLEYARGVASTYTPDPGGLVPIPNSSGGLLAHTVKLALRFGGGDRWLLVAEPTESGPILAEWLQVNHGISVEVSAFEDEIGAAWHSMQPNFDICDPFFDLSGVQPANVVITQALLEHVVDPVQAIRALSSVLVSGGILVIQTCNPFITLHRYPIDALRFFPDFFWKMSDYVAVTTEHVEEVNGSVYAVLRKK